MDLNAILAESVALGASDTHLKVGNPPTVRIHSRLYALEGAAPITRAEMDAVVDVPARRSPPRTVSAGPAGRPRIRASGSRPVPHQPLPAARASPRSRSATIPPHVRNVRELNLPPVSRRSRSSSAVSILVTGTTGSGKSTTLAVDDPSHQRELREPHHHGRGSDRVHARGRAVHHLAARDRLRLQRTSSEGLRGALRQDPDVILVGEMRDLETIETAILAAETGHLVMSLCIPSTRRRRSPVSISAFPEHQRDQIRLILSTVIKGIISQRLVPRADGQGMVPAVEVLRVDGAHRRVHRVKEKTPRSATRSRTAIRPTACRRSISR